VITERRHGSLGGPRIKAAIKAADEEADPSPMGTSTEQDRILEALEADAEEALALARWMGEHPELSLEEHETSRRYAASLRERGFAVETGVAGMPTAFLASRGADDAPCAVALLAEMDALPEIGHACGHNLSGPASLLAAWALVDLLGEAEARIVVVGCPAEELGIGKRRLVEAGVFRNLDAAMMAHASDMRRAHRLFLGNRKFDLVFHGRASHAAAYPEQGVNALDAVVQLFVGIGLLRQQLPRGVRIHGIITDGGRAPNVIPERAAAQLWVRALDEAELADAAERVLACARGAAASAGARLEVLPLESSSPPMRPSPPLADCYRRQLQRLGLPETAHAPDQAIGSSDVTHVSRAVPTIHPNFPIGRGLQLHTRAFAEATAGAEGRAGLLEAARALALTTHELVRSPALRKEVAAAFAAEASPNGG
jgi:amidohydrolase